MTIQLYDFQRLAIEKFRKNHQLLVSIPTGGGKTVVALSIIEDFVKNTNRKVLIVTPANLRDNFVDSVKKFNLGSVIKPIVLKSADDLKLNYKLKNCFIISYNYLYNYIGDVLKYHFDLLVIDELHYSKNDDTRNFENISKLRQHIPNILGLTASPVMNTPEEFFNLMSLIANDESIRDDYKRHVEYGYIGAKSFNFFEKFFLGKQDIKGVYSPITVKQTPEFNEKIKPLIYIPHPDRIKSIGKRPTPIYKIINVPITQYEEMAYKYALKEIPEKYVKKLFSNSLPESDLVKIKNKLIAIQQILLTPDYVKLGEESHQPGSKIRKIGEYIKHNKNKSIVFTPFLKVGAKVANEYFNKIGIESSLYSGEQSAEERKSIIDRFENGTLQVICLTTAGVEGLNLPSCKDIYFASLHFNPEIIEQTIGRALRITSQHETVNVYFMLAVIKKSNFLFISSESETLDHIMMNIVKRKTVFKNNLFKVIYESATNWFIA